MKRGEFIKSDYTPKHHNTKHGYYGTRIYRIWRGMKTRCQNPNDHAYKNYGARGITICDQWNDFVNFLEDMGIPDVAYEIDRIDNNLGYFKENCRWVTTKENNRNKRTVHLYPYKGQRLTVDELVEITGKGRWLMYERLRKGYTVEEILSE